MRPIHFAEKLERVINAGVSTELFGTAILCGSLDAARRFPSQYESRAISSEYMGNEARRVAYEIDSVLRRSRNNSRYVFNTGEFGLLERFNTPSRMYCSLDAGLLLLDAENGTTNSVIKSLPIVAAKIGESFFDAIPSLKALPHKNNLTTSYRACVTHLQECVAGYVNNTAIKGIEIK